MKGRIFGPDGPIEITEESDLSTLSSMIFVSHRRTDLSRAEEVARCIATYGLTPYLDEEDPEVNGDRPGLINHFLMIIHQSSGLIVVASAETYKSWWVPGEVFAGHDNGSLIGTYRLPSVSLDNLPSYLRYDWPIMKDHDGLHTWCQKFKEVSPFRQPSSSFLTEAANRAGIHPEDFYGKFTNGQDGIEIFR